MHLIPSPYCLIVIIFQLVVISSVFDVSRTAPGHQDRTITYSQTTHQIYGDIVVRFCVASLQNIIYNDPSEDLTAGNKIQASIFHFQV